MVDVSVDLVVSEESVIVTVIEWGLSFVICVSAVAVDTFVVVTVSGESVISMALHCIVSIEPAENDAEGM